MPKLARKTHRLFAGDAPAQGNLAQFGSEAAGKSNFTGDPEQIQILPAWGAGWGGAVVRNKVPPMQDMNALQYTFSYQLAYLLQMGVPEWKEDQEYYRNSFCQSGGFLYVSKLDDNVGRAVADTNYWRLFITTGSGPTSDRPPTAPTEYQYYDTTAGAWMFFVNGGWRVVDGRPGEIRFFMQSRESLPAGWYYPDGRFVILDSPLGMALQGLPSQLRADWGAINLWAGTIAGIRMFDPAKFFGVNGDGGLAGRFPRFAGVVPPGTVYGDAIRNITGYMAANCASTQTSGAAPPDSAEHQPGFGGALDRDGNRYWDNSSQGTTDARGTIFDASRVVPTANENRPLSVAMTPGVFLGVTGFPSYGA
ncbi:MAG: hypothetical protein LBK99_19255 [Opitutaceae bacterium]|jgi:hypothetical protein|nr:hypothetical protein [Opitutaceae bacterium]